MSEIKKRILVVDDDKTIHEFFRHLFSPMNVEVVEAKDGSQAVELAQQGGFDMYFLDRHMPGINGIETFRGIRRVYPNAKIVMITGYDIDDELKQAQQEGAVAVIQKPFDITQLTDVFQNITDQKKEKPKKILVIDDDKTILVFFANLLSNFEQGYKIASSKKEAIEALKKEKYDLIFLDLILEDGTGAEIYEEIKKISPEANIIVITGYHSQAKNITENMQLLGCLFKPFGISEIISYIEKVKAKS